MSLRSLETPSLILDRTKLAANLASMRRRMDRLGIALRVHGKTAKNIEVARMALGDRNEGITVSTLKEAEYYLSHGIVDMTYAVGIEPGKLERIARLVADGARLSVVVDSVEQVRAVAAEARRLGLSLPALIELDSDGHRSGVPTGAAALLDVGECLDQEDGMQLTGVLTHAGESYGCESMDAIREIAEVERRAAVEAAARLRAHGLPCPVVSIGSTPTATAAEDLSDVTEVRGRGLHVPRPGHGWIGRMRGGRHRRLGAGVGDRLPKIQAVADRGRRLDGPFPGPGHRVAAGRPGLWLGV